MKKSKSKDIPSTGPVVRGNVAFIALKEIGELGDNGKKVLGIGYSGRMEAKPDMPLVLVEAILHKLLPHCHYSSDEAAEKDIAAFKASVNRLRYGERC